MAPLGSLLPLAAKTAAEEGKSVITAMLVVGLIFLGVIILGELSKYLRHRRHEMGDARRSPASGRELAALGRGDGTSAMLAASVTARRREADARRRPAPPVFYGRERPRHARSRSRAREIVASTI
jgi:hypothetical protein